MADKDGLTYYSELPEGYVLLKNYKDLFTVKAGEKVLTVDNAILRIGLELMLYNPQTKEYYPRVLSYSSNRTNYYKYFKDQNLFIKKE